MADLRPCSASLCLTPFLESSSLLGLALLESGLVRGPSRSTRRSLIGASSPPSSARTVKSQTLSVQIVYTKGSERLLTSGVHEHLALCFSPRRSAEFLQDMSQVPLIYSGFLPIHYGLGSLSCERLFPH